MKWNPIVVDGLIYVLVAVCAAFGAGIGSDEAAKHVSPGTLFWTRNTLSAIGAGLLALKMYRSEAYGRWKEEERQENLLEKKL